MEQITQHEFYWGPKPEYPLWLSQKKTYKLSQKKTYIVQRTEVESLVVDGKVQFIFKHYVIDEETILEQDRLADEAASPYG